MAGSFRLVQLSDCHIGAGWSDADPGTALRQVVDEVGRLHAAPDAVVITGDLADHGDPAQYAVVRELVAPLGAPVHVLPGNHDDRAALRTSFGLAGPPAAPVQYAVDLGLVRLVALDTTRPGSDGGELGPERLGWLDAELSRAPGQPTIVAMHHPPFAIGVAVWDAIGLPDPDRRELAEVVGRHPQVRGLIAGHLHQPITGAVAGRLAMTIPSTYMQARLDFTATKLEFGGAPPGFAVHTVTGGELVSQVVGVASGVR